MMKKIMLLGIAVLAFNGCSVSNVTINSDFNMLALKVSEGQAIGANQKPRLSGVKPIY